MQIPGNMNKNGAKHMHISARAAEIVHAERGSRKIPDSHNRPHPTEAVVDASTYATPDHSPLDHTGTDKIPDSYNNRFKGA